METYEVFSVIADPATGEWITTPWFTGEKVSAEWWYSLDDTDEVHFDTYQHDDGKRQITRAVMVNWQSYD
jgi:hypothetical protein